MLQKRHGFVFPPGAQKLFREKSSQLCRGPDIHAIAMPGAITSDIIGIALLLS